MRKCLITSICAVFSFLLSGQDIVSPSEFSVLLGDDWQGSLTYRDYTSNQETEIPVTLLVEQVGDREFRFSYSYPEEPKANNKTKVVVGKNHMSINKARIISRQDLPNQVLKFATKIPGKDNKKKATIYTEYLLSVKNFTITKKVQYEGEDPFIRNTYSFSR